MDQQIEKSVLFRQLILNTRKPLVFRKFPTNWKCFDCSIEDWCKRFDANQSKEHSPEFEKMPTKFGDIPQWERFRSKLTTTFTNFLEKYSKDEENWSAFYYEPNTQIPIECRYDIDFSCFGFSKDKINDTSFWLSSKGANTPCHYDTYGCNIVVQVYGRKHWLLFPPDTKLTPIRVPYEESSVYCSENFYSPKNLDRFSIARENAFECILTEGDVLIVPRNWWHYVESLETSLSVNTWIPLKIDIDAQIDECIVKYIVESTLSQECEEKKRYILNPNQLQLITSSDELFDILQILVKNKSTEDQTDEKYSYQYLSEKEVNKLIEKCHNDVSVLPLLSPEKFDSILRDRTKRYVDMEPLHKADIHSMHEALLNAICHPNMINNIKEEFLRNIEKNCMIRYIYS
ncbi:HSPB1-associated protein 1 homolog [Episyrphus balteatus]|uniref:HSPB1-associated protein 1 homolog n=1 Tax=Episyrphus balteatus TaxID=286459 RepID=UPI002485347B|nr:HSPB1-associated protein 1 homolog [Episyrphus balteatus]